jgi:xylan 1,4-beta-xylosidase
MTAQPIIAGFFPDPSICRAGERYYVVNSSFEYLPGLPIHTSTDLVNWTPVGNALTRTDQIRQHPGAANSGIYAPTIRHHDGKFWIIGTNLLDLGDGLGHFIITAEDPQGPWSEPVHLRGTVGIDPDITWDEDGVCRVTWVSVHPELSGIVSAPIDPTSGKFLEDPIRLWQGTGQAHPEGPHLYRVNDWWYLLLAEGGTERSHTVTIARAHSLKGPWEPAPNNPILTHRGTDHPVQNTGHADLVQQADGSWAAVHLGVRPRGQTPGYHVNGRETFLVGIDWIDGWPVVIEDRYAVLAPDHSFTDRFETGALDQRWMGAGSFPASFTTPLSPGIRIDAASARPGKAFIAARTRDDVWVAEARFDASQGSGRFALRMDDNHWYGFDNEGETINAVLNVGPLEHRAGQFQVPPGSLPTLRISALPGVKNSYFGSDQPDMIELAVVTDDGTEHKMGSFDGRYISTEVAGGFLGRAISIEALTGQIDLRSVRYVTNHGAGSGAEAGEGKA